MEPEEPIPFIQMGQYKLQFELGPLTPRGVKVAQEELGETEETKSKAIKELRDLLKAEEKNGLVVPSDNDHWLVRFLRKCKYSPQDAFELIQKLYQFRQKHPEIYKDLIPSNEKKCLTAGINVALPLRDQDGRRVFIIELGST